MKLDVISEKDNSLRKRKEYWLMTDHASKETPSRHVMLPEVARKLGIKEELILIDKIFSERGTAKSRVKVLVYNEKKEVPKEKLERQVRKTNKFLEKKEAAAAVPPEPAADASGESGEVQNEENEKPEEKQTEDAPSEEPSEEELPEENAAEEPKEDAPSEESNEEPNKE